MTTFVAQDTASAFTTKMAEDDTGVGLSLAEDVSDFIHMIDPTETPLLTMLKKKRANAISHEWLSDALAAAASNTNEEGDLFESDTITGRTRYRNVCQISIKAYEVSGSMEAVTQYGIKSELAYQAVKKMKEIKRDVNFDLWQNASADGDSADMSARATEGYHEMISANAVPKAASGDATFTVANMTGDSAEDTFNAVLQDIYTSGPKASVAFMLPAVKRKVSRWTGVATKYFDQEAKRLVNVIDYYESDFGTVRFIMDRNMAVPTALHDHLLVTGDFGAAGIAYLRPFKNMRVEVPKDAKAGVVMTEYANEYGHPGTYGYMSTST